MNHKISERVDRILVEFYLSKMKAKADNLEREAGIYLKSKPGKYPNLCFAISSHKITTLSESYFLDVIRYKDYHMSLDFKNTQALKDLSGYSWEYSVHHHEYGKRISMSKIATLTAKWFLKSLPICVIPEKGINMQLLNDKDKKFMNFVNEIFLLNHIFKLLHIDANKIINKDEIYDLIYTFKYRHFDEASMHLIFDKLWEQYGDRHLHQKNPKSGD